MLRPLSQSGFHRIPKSPRQRISADGGVKTPGVVLENFNERQDDRVLHPTKGFRKLSVRRGRAQMLVASIRTGGYAGTKAMRRFLQQGY